MSDNFTTILRLFVGRSYAIGYDYSRSDYDYSSRNATTIADLYWLSGESPKRDTAVAANGSAPPAALLPRPASMVCDMLHCLAWIHNGDVSPHPYIPYYNRRSVLSCTASGVVQAALYPLLPVLYLRRLSGTNHRKSTCKALCTVL